MTLVVYANNRFYADDLALVDPKSINLQFRHGVKKVRVVGYGNGREIAVAVCGPFPWEKNWEKVMNVIRRIAYYADQGVTKSLELTLPEDAELENFLNISNLKRSTTYMIATKRMLYKLDDGGLSVLDRNYEYAHGSGRTYYGICRKAGMTVEESYAKVAQYEKTVGKLLCNVDLSNMTDLVDNVVQYMRTGKKKDLKLAAKVESFANRARKELEQ